MKRIDMYNMKNTVANRESEPLKQPTSPSEKIFIDKKLIAKE